MKRMMRNGHNIRRGVSLLLMMSLLITLVPIAAVAVTTPGAYGTVTVTTKNVVIRTSPAGSRTGYFAQPGTYPMIGPAIVVNGVTWYNLQTDNASGYVHGDFSYCTYGGAGMPDTDKTYVKFSAVTNIYKGDNAANPDSTTAVPVTVGTVLQLETGTPYAAAVGGTTSQYINLYFNNVVYHTLYTAALVADILSADALNAYIADITWQASSTGLTADLNDKGDFLTHAVQAALKILEYYDDVVDGNYGPNTYAAVQKFRTDNSLNANTGATNEAVLNKLFPQATDRLEYLRSNPGLTTGSSGSSGGTTTSNTILTTVDKLRIRKAATKSSAYLGIIPSQGTVLTYTRTQLNGTVTWYYIQYHGTYGWVMGTYVKEASSSGGDSTTPDITDYGTVTITKRWTHIRKTPNGAQSGYHLNIGDVATMIGPATEAGGYTWYYIRTEYGRTGYVRSDCADADFGSAGMPTTDKKYVQFLYDNMTVIPGSSPSNATGTAISVAKNTVLQLLTGISYAEGGVNYINVYYNNEVCYTPYNTNFVNGLMTTDQANEHITDVIWATGIPAGEIAGQTLGGSVTIRTGDIYVHAIQAALYQLGLFTDTIDGIFGPKTATAVKAYKTNYGLSPINEVINATDSVSLFTSGAAALEAKRNGTGGTGGDTPNVGEFGSVSIVKKGSWAEVDGGSKSLFPKGTVATFMSVATKQVFRLYRWSGANHADCVPYDTTDTAVLCSILGVTYSSSKPSSSELSLIKGAGDDDWPDYTWPKMRWAGTTYANTDKIPVWVNLDGTVYCASIYAIPHGYTGTSSFSLSKRDGEYYYELNNMYGMLCVHFYGSTTHSTGTVNQTHMDNINFAYNSAAGYFGASKVQ